MTVIEKQRIQSKISMVAFLFAGIAIAFALKKGKSSWWVAGYGVLGIAIGTVIGVMIFDKKESSFYRS
jgi:uncharacterized membrane protein YfcA